MIMEWLNMFSGGLDLIPILIAIYLLYYIPKVLPTAKDGSKIAYILSLLMAVCMIIAQSGWVYAVTQNVYLLGTAFDNIWLIVNTCAVAIPILFAQDALEGDE